VALDCRDDGARQPDEAERPRLRGEREQHRDDEGDLVRPEKPEETNESPAVAGRRGHALRLRAGPNSTELCVHERDGEFDLGAVRGRVEPAARAGGMGERDRDDIAGQLVPVANAHADGRYSQQATRREAADRDDERRADDRELPFAPKGAEVLLLRRRRAVAAARRRLARVTAGDRGAVEGLVELVLLQPEPPAQRPAGAAPPRPSLEAFLDARRLAEEVGALPVERGDHRQRLERMAGLDAGPADAQVALERAERAIGGTTPRHGLRTATNH